MKFRLDFVTNSSSSSFVCSTYIKTDRNKAYLVSQKSSYHCDELINEKNNNKSETKRPAFVYDRLLELVKQGEVIYNDEKVVSIIFEDYAEAHGVYCGILYPKIEELKEDILVNNSINVDKRTMKIIKEYINNASESTIFSVTKQKIFDVESQQTSIISSLDEENIFCGEAYIDNLENEDLLPNYKKQDKKKQISSVSLEESIEYLKLNKKEDYYTVSGIKGKISEVFIPSIYNGIPIKEIERKAFLGQKSLQKVIIDDGVTTIMDMAFLGCSNLETVVLPNTLKVIYQKAFSGCERLKDIIIPESVIKIGASAFCNCKSLTSISLPDLLKQIGN